MQSKKVEAQYFLLVLLETWKSNVEKERYLVHYWQTFQ